MKLTFHDPSLIPGSWRSQTAFTLAEVVMSAAIAAMTVSGIIYGYTQSTKRAEWSGYSQAAQAIAVQRMEQTRACKWDPGSGVDQLVSSNYPVQVAILDLPVVGTNIAYATNITTITSISTNQPYLRMIQVDCIWKFPTTGRVFTNTLATYRSPDT